MVGDSCSCEWLSEQLATNAGLISVIDCRPQSDYTVQHVIGSSNLTVPSLMTRRLYRGNLPMTSVIACLQQSRTDPHRVIDWKAQLIVLYDGVSGTDSMDDVTPSLATLLLSRFKQDGYKVSLLDGGFDKFINSYPHLCTAESEDAFESALLGVGTLKISTSESHHLPPSNGCERRKDLDQSAVVGGSPVEVIRHLFLGDAHNAADLQYLHDKGIKYIINVTHDIPNKFAADGQFKYLTIPISDHWSQNLSVYFPKAIRFIDEAMREDCGVLVHCLAGISRSVTITIAYLMATQSLSLNDAYDFVKRAKPNVSPNLNFMGQLLDFERQLGLSYKQLDGVEPLGDVVLNTSEVVTASIISPPGSSLSSLSSAALTSSCTSTSSTFNYETVFKE